MKVVFKLLSYFFPVTLKTFATPFNGLIELNMVNGRRVLDSAVSNYSYGSLQRILRKGLIELKIGKDMNHILVLGLGGGCVIELLRAEFDCPSLITAIEIDPCMIEIARQEFNVDAYRHLSIIEADAANYMRAQNTKFDLIIVDVFVGNTVPVRLISQVFIDDLCRSLCAGGKVLFNTMKDTLLSTEYSLINQRLIDNRMRVRTIEQVEDTNTLILAEKI